MIALRSWAVRLIVTSICAAAFGSAAYGTFGFVAACWVAIFVVVAILPYTLAVGWR